MGQGCKIHSWGDEQASMRRQTPLLVGAHMYMHLITQLDTTIRMGWRAAIR
jgi:hypothetical protein